LTLAHRSSPQVVCNPGHDVGESAARDIDGFSEVLVDSCLARKRLSGIR
jgi:hypothetical protein